MDLVIVKTDPVLSAVPLGAITVIWSSYPNPDIVIPTGGK
jgi:hypothetical protein